LHAFIHLIFKILLKQTQKEVSVCLEDEVPKLEPHFFANKLKTILENLKHLRQKIGAIPPNATPVPELAQIIDL